MKLTNQEINSRKIILFDLLEALVLNQAVSITIDSTDALEAVAMQHKLYQDAVRAIKLAIGDDDV